MAFSRLFLAAFGDPGHAFPMLALGRELAARGHEVLFETSDRWEADIRGAGMAFVAAPEFPDIPAPGRRAAEALRGGREVGRVDAADDGRVRA